jgi:RNA polymerase sigma-70 factor (ECF subfamily)
MKQMAAQMDWWRRRSADNSDEFVRRYREPVYRLALAIIGRPEVAEDVAQDSLLRGLRHQESLEDPLTWLRVATVRRALSALKSARPDISESEPSSRPDAAEAIAVRQTLAALPPDQQTILALALGEGWSYGEIAEALEIPIGTVGSRIHAAKEAFRKKWGSER